MLSEYAYILKADISRFFYTVNTHSLPWAVLGKEKAKNWHFNKRKSLDKHWSSHLDKALQACQSRETFGIPVGPDTSRVIAEILMSDVARVTGLNGPVNESRMIRLVDDFLIGFHDEQSAFKALAKLRNFLWTYNLQLNEAKTGVHASKTQYNDNWEHDFELLHISETDVSQQAKDINKILDLALSISSHQPSANAINWACSRMSLVKNNVENFELILEVLLRLGRDFPASLPHVCSFLINNQDLCHSKNLVPKIERSLKRLVNLHHQHGHDSEVAWCLLAASVLRVSWDFVELGSPDSLPRPAVFAIVGLMHEHGLLNFSLSKWPWKSQLKTAGIMGDHWLPFYESVRRGWTKDKVMINAVKSHPVLSKMLSHDVTFLEDSALKARKIDLKKRVFKKGYNNSSVASRREKLLFQISVEGYE